MSDIKISDKERRHIVETLMLCTSYAAAKQLGVPRDNITMLLADPGMARDIAKARKELIEVTTNQLISARGEAIAFLVQTVNNDSSAMKFRMEAAGKLLDSSWSYIQQEQVHDKLLEIEKRMDESGA